jgi:hypothetical protein
VYQPLPLVTKSYAGGMPAPARTPQSQQDDGLDELLRSEPPVPYDNAGPSEDLVLDAFDEEPKAPRPVVLLGNRQRKTNRPPPGGEDTAEHDLPRSKEYMSDLERRLDLDDDDDSR